MNSHCSEPNPISIIKHLRKSADWYADQPEHPKYGRQYVKRARKLRQAAYLIENLTREGHNGFKPREKLLYDLGEGVKVRVTYHGFDEGRAVITADADGDDAIPVTVRFSKLSHREATETEQPNMLVCNQPSI